MDKLSYLRKYSKTIEIVEFSALNSIEKTKLPAYLSSAFELHNRTDKLNRILNEWKKYTHQFQSTISYLEENLTDVEIIRHKGEISTLYSIKNLKGEIVYYEGKLPLTHNQYASQIPRWDELPDTVKAIYENLHNGWYYFASQSMGLSSVENIIALGDMDWGILDEIDVNSLPFKLEDCLGIFHNGMGDYVCLDLKSRDKDSGFIWWKAKPPKLNIEFWNVVDEWTKIGMEK